MIAFLEVYFFIGLFFMVTSLPAILSKKWFVDGLNLKLDGWRAAALVSVLVMAAWPVYFVSRLAAARELIKKSGQNPDKKA